MRKFFAVVATTAMVLACQAALANHDSMVTSWTRDVGETIETISVRSDEPKSARRVVTITYRALKACRSLRILGKNYSHKRAELQTFTLARKTVVAGQVFRAQIVFAYEAEHYIALEESICH